MRGKLLFVTGIAVGYVLGARAGRKRYEQIKSAAESVWNTPTVQKGVDSAKDFAFARVGDVSDLVLDGAKKLISTATGSKKSSSASRPAPVRVTPVPAPAPAAASAPVADPSAPAAPSAARKPAAKKPSATTGATDPE